MSTKIALPSSMGLYCRYLKFLNCDSVTPYLLPLLLTTCLFVHLLHTHTYYSYYLPGWIFFYFVHLCHILSIYFTLFYLPQLLCVWTSFYVYECSKSIRGDMIHISTCSRCTVYSSLFFSLSRDFSCYRLWFFGLCIHTYLRV
ncbi:hypothetical protein BDN70DRAFT_105329 [Pholiota conissans]|uniref:Uncharacterized protein n=1 Tax=Pholiota conissans TaxID=109636 RepID=A0A9P5ZDQ6_9AGAR|nr:hypothetical protein BDN70DRAFT_105329 [Pholiota conissans]